MNDKINPIRPVDDEAKALAASLLAGASIASLATVDPETGGPSVGRVLIASYGGGRLVTMISDLSLHTQALDRDPRCALLVGEPGKGDPLAHARLTVIATASRMPAEAKADAAFAGAFLARHPKARLYFGFTDFSFWRFDCIRIDLNGGFGKAYRLLPADLA